MCPDRAVPPAFLNVSEPLGAPLPLMEAFLSRVAGRPLEGVRLLLVQHQLINQLPMVEGLVRLGADPSQIYWLDIPYTSHQEIRDYAVANLSVEAEHFWLSDDYRILDPYAPYQFRRTLKAVLSLGAPSDQPLVVLDDGAYVLKALSALSQSRWPTPIAIVEQTTRGLIKMRASAAMRARARCLPLVDVAESTPKKTLEPPFIGVAVCVSLGRSLAGPLKGRALRSALVLGYGAIGEQVASYLSRHFGLTKAAIHVGDTDEARQAKAVRRGFSAWNPADLRARFELVIGCSGQASFQLGHREYLADGALLVSASSGEVELCRRAFVELADASDLDDISILRKGLNEADRHAEVDIQLVDRVATFVNGGFPVTFDRSLATVPSHYIQPTPVMMVAAAVQARRALERGQTGVLALDPGLCDWIDPAFRSLLGEEAHYLIPPPEEAW